VNQRTPASKKHVTNPVEREEIATIQSRITRFFSRDGTSACTRDIVARFDFTNNGWAVSFYKQQWEARQGHNKITTIPSSSADLVAQAMECASNLEEPHEL